MVITASVEYLVLRFGSKTKSWRGFYWLLVANAVTVELALLMSGLRADQYRQIASLQEMKV